MTEALENKRLCEIEFSIKVLAMDAAYQDEINRLQAAGWQALGVPVAVFTLYRDRVIETTSEEQAPMMQMLIDEGAVTVINSEAKEST